MANVGRDDLGQSRRARRVFLVNYRVVELKGMLRSFRLAQGPQHDKNQSAGL